MKKFKYVPGNQSLKLDQSSCSRCGLCIQVCPHNVFSRKEKSVVISAKEYCMECGACAMNCETGAISIDMGNGCGCATGIIEGFFSSEKKDNGCSCC